MPDRKTKLADFRASLGATVPPDGLSDPLAALWHLEKGNWEAAHNLAQDDPSPEGAWVHAHIHRIEGDDWNARYWYRRAGREAGQGDLGAERSAIIMALIDR